MKRGILSCLVGFLSFVFLLSCGGGIPKLPDGILDISVNEIFDAYVDIAGLATPSLYSAPETPIELSPFSPVLTITLEKSEGTVFHILFLGKAYDLEFGTLNIDLTEAESGLYPLTVTTRAGVSSRDSQKQVWIKVDNGIEMPKVTLTWLEKELATIELFWKTDSAENAFVSLYLRADTAGEAIDFGIEELQPNVGRPVTFPNLQKGQSYQVGLKRNGEPAINWLASFKTFRDMEEGFQLFYWLDLTEPSTHKVKVGVFGYYKDLSELYLDNYGYHTEGGLARAQERELYSEPEISMDIQENNKLLQFDLKNNPEGYFRLSYTSDKNAIVTSNHGIQGYFCPDYLIASHEQILYGPGAFIGRSGILNENPDFFRASLSLYMLGGWDASTGWEEESPGVYTFPATYSSKIEEFFHASHIYAYQSDAFIKETKQYGAHSFHIILSGSVDRRIINDLQTIYQFLTALWGGTMDIPAYTIMITDPPNNDQSLYAYAGEWSTGQGFSSNWGIIGEMVIHQMFHLWNAWAKGIPCTHDYHMGFWYEGVNEYYCDKILTEIDFQTSSFPPHPCLEEWYRIYKTVRGTSADKPLIIKDEGDPFPDKTLVYWKGAVFAYALDREIRNRSSGRYSLDDFLKHLLIQYNERGVLFSYAAILDYLRQIIPTGLDDWWQQYMVNNEPLFLEEFE